MTRSELIFLVWSDLDRLHKNPRFTHLVRELLTGQGFRYLFWFRMSQYLASKAGWSFPLRLLTTIIRHHYSYKFGIELGLTTRVGPGLKIEHYGTIFVNGRSHIGMRCTICQGVTLGEYGGAPTVGDFCFIGPGAKAIGPVTIGNNAIIGANCVVTKDVTENAVMGGLPGKEISLAGNLRRERRSEAAELRECYRIRCPKACLGNYGLTDQPADSEAETYRG